ncbi:unnamed protein product, partial [Ilex paraguariensis]
TKTQKYRRQADISLQVILKMYENSACFDPNNVQGLAEDGFSQTHVPKFTPTFSMEEPSYHHQNPPEEGGATAGRVAAAMEIKLQQPPSMEMKHYYNTHNNHSDTQFMQEAVSCDQSNCEMSFSHYSHQQEHHFQQVETPNGHYQGLNTSSFLDTPYPLTPDHHNLFHLPGCSSSFLLHNASVSTGSTNFPRSLSFLGDLNAAGSVPASNAFYNPLLPLNLPPQPPMFRELIQSLPHGYSLTGSGIGSLFNGVDEREASGGGYQDGDGRPFDSGSLEFSGDIRGRDGKDNIEKKEGWT